MAQFDESKVIGAFLQYLLNMSGEKGVKIEYPVGTLTFIKTGGKE